MKTFLKAEWRKLIMMNYEVDPKLLAPYLPFNTEPDFWNGSCYVSLVGFMFLNTRIIGLKIPMHINFEEVNLRFYVRYKHADQWKRGVVFIKEIVPRPALTIVANTLYREKYETMPMSHDWHISNIEQTVEYKWRKNKEWNAIKVTTAPDAKFIAEDSEAEFITEHYWGYTKINALKTSEYAVEHPRWEVYDVIDYKIDVDFTAVYGKDFGFLKAILPTSVFLAEGSEISVKQGQKI
jgi:uncharacterized protein YqjF (DUF2071 family)